MLTNFPVSAKAPAAAAVLAKNGLIQGYFRYTVGTRSLRELAKLWWQIARWRPQVLVYLGAARGIETAQRDWKFFRLCGIRRQVGVPLTEEMQANLEQAEHGGALEPEFERLARNLVELGDARVTSREAWDLRLTEAETSRARRALAAAAGRPILAVSVGTKVQAKDWGRHNWRELLRVVGAAHPEFVVAMTGAIEEFDASEYVAQGWREGAGPEALAINLCGTLTPRESAACFAQSKVFLGHDSGPMHLAATVGTPCVAVFAARNIPRVWYPQGDQHRVIYHAVNCMGCHLETCITERKKCLTSITVDEVARELYAALRLSPA